MIRPWRNRRQLRQEQVRLAGYRRAELDRRVDDLLGRMTGEKAGMLFQTMIMVGSGDLAERSSAFGVESAEHMINNQLLSHFNVVQASQHAGCCGRSSSSGYFDNPHVDIDHAAATVGKAVVRCRRSRCPAAAYPLLTNHDQILRSGSPAASMQKASPRSLPRGTERWL